MVILSLAIDLFGYWKLGGMLRSRLDYTEDDSVRWKKEFDAAQGSTPWPFTKAIDRWAVGLRAARTWFADPWGSIFPSCVVLVARNSCSISAQIKQSFVVTRSGSQPQLLV
jgi:hypothetical protein